MAETPSRGGENVQGVDMDEDQTVRIGSGFAITQQGEQGETQSVQVQQEVAATEKEQPVIQEGPEAPKPVQKEKEGYLEGVQVKLPIVAQAIVSFITLYRSPPYKIQETDLPGQIARRLTRDDASRLSGRARTAKQRRIDHVCSP